MAEQSLKEKTAKGLFWGGVSNGMQQLLGLLFGIFLARLLTPADYGMVGMLSIFSLIASSLQESGFTAALANRKEVRSEDYNAVFWFNIFCSGCLYMVLFLCAPLIAAFYQQPELTKLARYTFLGFFISSSGIAHNAYLFRHLMVKQKAIAQVTAICLSGCVGVTLAYFGFAYWGIATQSLVYIAVLTSCYWYFSPWRPTFSFDFSPIRSMFGFSIKLVITNLFSNINHNFLSLILGRYYSETEVGYYNQATKWNSMGYLSISGMINGVAQPVLAGVNDERERQLRIFRKMLRFAAFVSFPAMLGLGLVAEELITLAVTSKWLPSASLMQLLCLWGAFVPVIGLYQQLIISKGKSTLYMWNIIALGILLLSAVLLAHPYGIRTMLMLYVGIQIAWLLLWNYWVWREIGLTLWHTLLDILPYASTAVTVMVAAHYLTLDWPDICLRLAGKVGIAASLYILIMWLSRSVTFKESIRYLRHIKKR
ncbi:MAG: lipopolysaccharide biosynthesis protein [Bacteroides sp.]|nr:lipopolysaccharide biosynthesis protein [Bacteroides sp.]